MIFDVNEEGFPEQVVERSKTVPVVVDFWAAWCGPCRQLTPALEQAATAREGSVDLAKVDVDRNQRLAQTFRVQGIPAVKAFRDGAVVSEFAGAVAATEVERFFDGLASSPADELAERGERDEDEGLLRRALELDPRHVDAARVLGRLLLRRSEPAEALAVLEPFVHDFVAAGLAARARLDGIVGEDGQRAFAAWDAGDHATALELLQDTFAHAESGEERDLARQVMVAIFTELGPDHELARDHRRRLSAALY